MVLLVTMIVKPSACMVSGGREHIPLDEAIATATWAYTVSIVRVDPTLAPLVSGVWLLG